MNNRITLARKAVSLCMKDMTVDEMADAFDYPTWIIKGMIKQIEYAKTK